MATKQQISIVAFLVLVSLTLFLSYGIEKGAPPTLTAEPTLGEVDTTTYFAEVDKNGLVLRVIVASQDFINSGKVGDPNKWVQTYMNTDPSRNIRKNYAGIGYSYDKEVPNAFVAPKPRPDSVLDAVKARWDVDKITTP